MYRPRENQTRPAANDEAGPPGAGKEEWEILVDILTVVDTTKQNERSMMGTEWMDVTNVTQRKPSTASDNL
ncbi:hypothetical protein PDE_03405 [Penicillium oxalicum 114-2]|uniref:Uncharacterized protein n=1 Tax=Penicillium oxalicum (strain 114-2 / CGMCC 5302) TaxID=933388 RepID=S7ZDV0_PENO1|nr:hypothetical protein PDE_03405 [Penicillium oxalicum 114-2]